MSRLAALLEELLVHRRVVMAGWSADTVAPGWSYQEGRPIGQCGPTALWVTLFLRQRDHDALFVCGSVTVRGDVSIGNHCWTEVDDVIVDLTCGQGAGIAVDSIATRRDDLKSTGIKYISCEVFTPHEVPEELWQRYKVMIAQIPDSAPGVSLKL